jgi:putative membrane protein
MRRAFVYAAAAAAALIWVTAANASAYAPEAARSAGRLSREQREERALLRSAAAVSRFEAEASRLVLARSENPGVRAWASELLRRQEANQAELMHLLHGRGMALPMLENDQRRQLSRLARLSGARLDREFMESVALRQRARLQALEKDQLAAGDPAVKGWIERQVTPVREQAEAAERLGADGRSSVAARGLRPSLVSGSSTR